MTQMFLLGDDCLTVSMEPNENKHSIAEHLRATKCWSEVVVGKQDITVQYDPIILPPDAALNQLEEQLSHYVIVDSALGEIIEIPVSLSAENAPDLLHVAAQIELPANKVWDHLASRTFTIDMLGFTPGFAYMTGVPDDWTIERLSNPRQSVPAGSIGILTGQCGLYALEGPGGWPIIGRALIPLFDGEAMQSPLLYNANDRIRFAPDGRDHD